ncbi:MAG: carbohydrate binding domain-containing protein, partial [Chloroflexota bacterium]
VACDVPVPATAPPETPPPPTLTSTPTPSATSIPTLTFTPMPTSTSTPTPTNTPLPPPLVGVFLLVGDGVDFLFPEGKPDLIKRQFVEIGECLLSPPNGVQLTYNFTEGGGGWGIHWAAPPQKHLNLIGFTELTFWVKGTSGSETFQIGLKDTGQIEVQNDEKEILVNSERYVLVSSSEWRQVIVPLSHFADATGPVNFASIDNMSIGFSSAHGSGSICIDDIAFK